MKSILEFFNRNNFENRLGKIIFQLDENSLDLLSDNFKQLLESNNYEFSLDIIKESNRTVWTSRDGDNLKMGSHATEREDRPIDKGGDGEHIDESEIILMFRYVWHSMINEYNENWLNPRKYGVESFTIENRSYLEEEKQKIVPTGARPKNKYLWAAFMLKDADNYKVDVIIRTIFRGLTFKHGKRQERLLIGTKGNIIEIRPH